MTIVSIEAKTKDIINNTSSETLAKTKIDLTQANKDGKEDVFLDLAQFANCNAELPLSCDFRHARLFAMRRLRR